VERAAELAISPVVQGSAAKGDALGAMLADLGIDPARVAFVGDDLADLPAMEIAGLSACPADAAAEVRAYADLVTLAPGGRGAVREVVETILKGQQSWPEFPASRSPTV